MKKPTVTAFVVALALHALACDVFAQPRPGTPDAGTRVDAGTPPRDLPGAETALERGEYGLAVPAFERLAKGRTAGRALLGLARAQLETGRYDEAAQTAARAGRQRDVRVAAETLRAEALIARGRLDDAERALAALVEEASAHRARVLLGRLLIRRGRNAEAQSVLMRLIQSYNDQTITDRDGEGLAYVGMAARALGSYQDANDAFRESARAAPDRVETQLEWAQLFLEKYDAGHAEECVRDALRVNPESPLAHTLMARIRLEQAFDFPAANRELDHALRVNPSLVIAHVTRGGIALRDMDLAAADRHLDAALAVDPEDLEALSVRAAVRFLADDDAGWQRAKVEVFRRNARFSRFYSIVAEYADWEHRYPEIVRMAREAIALDPEDAYAHATLGMNLLRMGDERAGLDALREAWRRDRFNVHVFNTLELYDRVISREYVEVTAAPFVFRFHRDERPILERYVIPTMRRAWDDMVRRYGFTPRGPVRIELFATTRHFSVRTTGLPNVGVQGVCFGQVVTALSPSAGPFNWGQIIWHELSHVFHIQLSDNHVPRWFTEGLSEYETIVARPEWRREEDYLLRRALDGGRLPPLRDLNFAFTHARTPEDMAVAYYGSSQVVSYIVQRFGFEKVPDLLRGWAAGERTDALIQRVLGISIDRLDQDFRAELRRRFQSRPRDFDVDLGAFQDLEAARARAAAAPGDAQAQAELAAALIVSGNAREAVTVAQRAIGIASRQPIARYILARAAMAQQDTRTAEQHLRELIAGGNDGYEVRMLLARAAMARQDRAAARRELDAAIRIDRARPEAWHGIVEIATAANDADGKLAALLELGQIDQHDRETSAALLDELARRDRWGDVLRFGENALYLDPMRSESHRLLAEAYLRANRARDALYEAESALIARPEQPGRVHLTRARVFMALNRRPDAQRAAREAERADPSLAAEARAVLQGGGGARRPNPRPRR